MAVAVFVIAGTLTLVVQQRQREIALLRVIAATPTPDPSEDQDRDVRRHRSRRCRGGLARGPAGVTTRSGDDRPGLAPSDLRAPGRATTTPRCDRGRHGRRPIGGLHRRASSVSDAADAGVVTSHGPIYRSSAGSGHARGRCARRQRGPVRRRHVVQRDHCAVGIARDRDRGHGHRRSVRPSIGVGRRPAHRDPVAAGSVPVGSSPPRTPGPLHAGWPRRSRPSCCWSVSPA